MEVVVEVDNDDDDLDAGRRSLRQLLDVNKAHAVLLLPLLLPIVVAADKNIEY